MRGPEQVVDPDRGPTAPRPRDDDGMHARRGEVVDAHEELVPRRDGTVLDRTVGSRRLVSRLAMGFHGDCVLSEK